MTFEDCIERIEELGHKKEIQTNMHKIRNGMIDLDSAQPSRDDDDADNGRVATPPPDDNAFDLLVGTAPVPPQTTLTDEQRARMMRNRLLAEERRMARRLAREKELEEQRQAASRAAEANTASVISDNMDASNGDVSAATCDTNLQSAGGSITLEDVPSCVLDDPTAASDTAGGSSSNEKPRTLDSIQNGAADQSSAGTLQSTACHDVEEGSRVLHRDWSQSRADASDGQVEQEDPKTTHEAPAVEQCTTSSSAEKTDTSKYYPSDADSTASASDNARPLDSSSALYENGSQIANETSSPTSKEKTIGLQRGSPTNSDMLAHSVPTELQLAVFEPDFLDVEHTAEGNIGNITGSSCRAETHSSDPATQTKPDATSPAIVSEKPNPVSAVDDLMDIDSAENWEEAFAEEERALASQNHPQ